MAVYKTGIESKRKIYETAKGLFYEYGFENTSVDAIAKKAGVPKGLVTYYYKKKEMLAFAYDEYLILMIEQVEAQLGKEIENSFQWHMLMLRLFYEEVYSDPKKFVNFEYLMRSNLISEKASGILYSRLLRQMNEFKLAVEPEIYVMYLGAHYGAYKEVVRRHLIPYNKELADKLIYDLAAIPLRMAGVSPKLITKNTEKVKVMIGKVDLSSICFLGGGKEQNS